MNGNKLYTILRILPKQVSSVRRVLCQPHHALLAYLEKRATDAKLDSKHRFLQEQHISEEGFYSSEVITHLKASWLGAT